MWMPPRTSNCKKQQTNEGRRANERRRALRRRPAPRVGDRTHGATLARRENDNECRRSAARNSCGGKLEKQWRQRKRRGTATEAEQEERNGRRTRARDAKRHRCDERGALRKGKTEKRNGGASVSFLGVRTTAGRRGRWWRPGGRSAKIKTNNRPNKRTNNNSGLMIERTGGRGERAEPDGGARRRIRDHSNGAHSAQHRRHRRRNQWHAQTTAIAHTDTYTEKEGGREGGRQERRRAGSVQSDVKWAENE